MCAFDSSLSFRLVNASWRPLDWLLTAVVQGERVLLCSRGYSVLCACVCSQRFARWLGTHSFEREMNVYVCDCAGVHASSTGGREWECSGDVLTVVRLPASGAVGSVFSLAAFCTRTMPPAVEGAGEEGTGECF